MTQKRGCSAYSVSRLDALTAKTFLLLYMCSQMAWGEHHSRLPAQAILLSRAYAGTSPSSRLAEFLTAWKILGSSDCWSRLPGV